MVCDRFTDATYAYQGGGHGMPSERIHALEQWTHGDCQPDLTLLFDVPAGVSRARLDSAELAGRALDKFEREAMPFFTRVRTAYLERAAALPQRIRVIDSTRPLEVVRAEVVAHLTALGVAHDESNARPNPRGCPGHRCCRGRSMRRGRRCANARPGRMRCSSMARVVSASMRSRSTSQQGYCARTRTPTALPAVSARRADMPSQASTLTSCVSSF